MRRLILLGALAVTAWWLLTRRGSVPPRVLVGYADGSALEPPDGSRERERLLASARDVLRG